MSAKGPPKLRDPAPSGGAPFAPRGTKPSVEKGSGVSSFVLLGGVVAVLAIGGFYIGLSTAKKDVDPSELSPPPLPGEVPSSSASFVAPPPPKPRCAPVVADESFVLGEAPTRAPRDGSDLPPGIPGLDAPQAEPDEETSPFAVVLGRGVTTTTGFALGALRDGEGGTIATVVTLGADGRGGRVVRLARSRGDVEAPTVAAGPDGTLLVALLEPNAGGRALRLAQVKGEQVTWGAELSQSRDESLAIDLATSGDRALVAWDEADADASRVWIASFATKDVATTTQPRAVTGKKTDADAPRLVPRPGGFWLAYVARGELAKRAARPKEAVDHVDDDEIDEESGGERIETSWIEVMPLDELGAATGAAARISPREGTVLGFDIARGADGGAVVAWRDDASPTGGGGGTVHLVYVGPGGASEPRPLADDEVDDGVPDLLGFSTPSEGLSGGGWLAVASRKGPHAVGRIDERGGILGGVTPEPSLARSEPIAAAGSRLLLAVPEGRAVRLRVVACEDAAAPPPVDPAAPPPEEVLLPSGP